LIVTLVPGAAVPEIRASPEPVVIVLLMLTLDPDWCIGCSLPFVVVEVWRNG
jgi:hypothetical protein